MGIKILISLTLSVLLRKSGRFSLNVSGFKVVGKLLNQIQEGKRSKVITIIDVENSPLLDFVEGIMSNEKRV